MRLILAFVAWSAVAGAASAETRISPCSAVEADGTRTVCHEAVIAAPREALWRLISTSEGLRAWVAPVAAIDLRIGGDWETSYDPAARIGGAGNIHNRILSYAPGRMLSIQIAEAPAGFPHADEARQLWTVIELERVSARRTRVRVSMFGYGSGEGFDQLYAFFERGNALTLDHLARAATEGPIDWTEGAAR